MKSSKIIKKLFNLDFHEGNPVLFKGKIKSELGEVSSIVCASPTENYDDDHSVYYLCVHLGLPQGDFLCDDEMFMKNVKEEILKFGIPIPGKLNRAELGIQTKDQIVIELTDEQSYTIGEHSHLLWE
jgi:hypothetical protein